MDIIVTTPKNQMENAAKEAEYVKKHQEAYYFRNLSTKPKELEVGDKVWYVEDGYVRGNMVVFDVTIAMKTCETTGRVWKGVQVCLLADTWTWIKPIPHKGFQGWRYYDAPDDVEVVGGWLDEKPKVK